MQRISVCRVSNSVIFKIPAYLSCVFRTVVELNNRRSKTAGYITTKVCESVFKTYGVKDESTVSEKTIFIKVFKN